VSEDKFAIRKLAGDADLKLWDGFVAASPQANPFSTSGWLLNAGAAVGAEIEIWIASKGDRIVAGIPIPTRRMGERWHLGLPLSAYDTFVYRSRAAGHPAAATSEHLEVTEALLAATQKGIKNWSLLLSTAIDDVRPWIWAGWAARPRYTYVLDVSQPLQVAATVRPRLRKAQEAGMAMREEWDLDAIWSVFAGTQGRQGFGVRLTRQQFDRLARSLFEGGLARMEIAFAPDGEPAAGHIVLAVPGTQAAFQWIAGTNGRYLQSGVSAWQTVESAAELGRRGFRSWDLCGADLPSVARFKSDLGAALVTYYQVDAPRGAVESLYGALKSSVRKASRSVRRPPRS